MTIIQAFFLVWGPLDFDHFLEVSPNDIGTKSNKMLGKYRSIFLPRCYYCHCMCAVLGREMASIKYQFDTWAHFFRVHDHLSTQSQFPTLVSVLSSFLSPLLPFFFKGLRKMLILPSNFWVFLKSKCGIFLQDNLLSRKNSMIYTNFV